MTDIHSQPASDAYRHNWERIFIHKTKPIDWGKAFICPDCGEMTQIDLSHPCKRIEYPNGCPILNEDANA